MIYRTLEIPQGCHDLAANPEAREKGWGLFSKEELVDFDYRRPKAKDPPTGLIYAAS
jgi:hypothetical protein